MNFLLFPFIVSFSAPVDPRLCDPLIRYVCAIFTGEPSYCAPGAVVRVLPGVVLGCMAVVVDAVQYSISFINAMSHNFVYNVLYALDVILQH